MYGTCERRLTPPLFTYFNDILGRASRSTRPNTFATALDGAIWEPAGRAWKLELRIPRCAALVVIGTSVLGRNVRPLSSSYGEKPCTESRARPGARVPRRLRASSAAIVLRLKRKDCPSFGRGDGVLRAQGRRDGRAAHGHRVMPGGRSWVVRAVSIGDL